MLILTVRTDKPEAELSLYKDAKLLEKIQWEAHRQLAETIHTKILALLKSQKLDWHELKGLVVYQGPGSFTGLRIGLSVSNALAAGLHLPIVPVQGGDWQQKGIDRLLKGDNEYVALPEYGAEPHITQQKK